MVKLRMKDGQSLCVNRPGGLSVDRIPIDDHVSRDIDFEKKFVLFSDKVSFDQAVVYK